MFTLKKLLKAQQLLNICIMLSIYYFAILFIQKTIQIKQLYNVYYKKIFITYFIYLPNNLIIITEYKKKKRNRN